MEAGYIRSLVPSSGMGVRSGGGTSSAGGASNWELAFNPSYRSLGVLAQAAARLEATATRTQAAAAELWVSTTPRDSKTNSVQTTPRSVTTHLPPSPFATNSTALAAAVEGSSKICLPSQKAAASGLIPASVVDEPETERSPERRIGLERAMRPVPKLSAGGITRMTSAPVMRAAPFSMKVVARSRSPSCGGEEDKRGLIRRMRARRHLEDALSEGQRAAVLEAAVRLAKEADCSPQRIEDAKNKLGLVRELEDALVATDVLRVQEALVAAARGGVNAHVALACEKLPPDVVKCIEQVALQMPPPPPAATRSLSEASATGRIRASSLQPSITTEDSGDLAAEAAARQQRRTQELAAQAVVRQERRIVAARGAAESRLWAANDLDSLQVALTAARDVGVDASTIKEHQAFVENASHAWVSLQRVFMSFDCAAVQAALDVARGTKLGALKLSGCERSLQWMKVFNEQKFGNAFRFQADTPATEIIERVMELRSVILEGRCLLIPCGLEACFALAEKELGKLSALESLVAVVSKAKEVDIETGELDVLEHAKRAILKSVKDVMRAGLCESNVAFADAVRKRIHNKVQDRKGAVRVFCRIRPLSVEEIATGIQAAVTCTDPHTVMMDKPEDPSPRRQSQSSNPGTPRGGTPRRESSLSRDEPRQEESFGFFDACWSPGSQEQVFDNVRELVQSAVDGHNLTIFTYGQTGAGKTYTMYGKCEQPLNSGARKSVRGTQLVHYNPIGRPSSSNIRPSPNLPGRMRSGSRVGGPEMARAMSILEGPGEDPGICVRAANELFRLLQQSEDYFGYSVSFSMVELYCQRYIDLLDPTSDKTLKQRMTSQGEVYVENLHEEPMTSAADIKKWIMMGNRERHQRETACNAQSSRSHTVCIVKITTESRETGIKRQGKMLLVDLAGSERVKRSDVVGTGMREAIEVNRSLSALGDVLVALQKGEQHIPYRNHELTQLMQDSIGGTAKTLMFLNVSPAPCHLDETRVSLEFAQRIKSVVNKPQVGGQAKVASQRGSGPSPGASRRFSAMSARVCVQSSTLSPKTSPRTGRSLVATSSSRSSLIGPPMSSARPRQAP